MFARASRKFAMRVPVQAPRRAMGGGGHKKVDHGGGLEGYVRGIFPENYQMALAVMGLYAGLYTFSKLVGAITGGGKKAVVAAPVAVAAVSGDAIPSTDSAEFGDWLAQEGSFEKLLS
jgi:hypothetical protein